MNTCCLCPDRVSRHAPDFWNKPLVETDNFSVIPSLGSLVEGWLLLVPKAHVLCVGALPLNVMSEFDQLKHRMGNIVQQEFGDVCIFEHGPSSGGKQTGCSVDHAHMHVVPLHFDLAAGALPFMPQGTEWRPADWGTCHHAYEKGDDYLYLEQPIGFGRIATCKEFPSQVFRKAIASRLGALEEFSWREHPKVANIVRTLETWRSTQLSNNTSPLA